MASLLPRHQLWSIKKSARSVEIADQTGAANEGSLRFALADGTSTSPQARAWSQILARHACRVGIPRGDLMRWLSGAHDAWQERFQRRSKLWTQPDLPELGAAALCLVELQPTENGFRWSALLQGDVCLFHIRKARTIRRLPMEHSRDFGRSKPCFFSEPIALNHLPVQLTANATVGDVLVMASEPLARWIYTQLESGIDPWPELLSLPDDTSFAALVSRERASGRMRDDDTALMFIRTDPFEDNSILDAPTRHPVSPSSRPLRPPEIDNPANASEYEDIFDLELIAEPPSPDEATELSLPKPLDFLGDDLSDDSLSDDLSDEAFQAQPIQTDLPDDLELPLPEPPLKPSVSDNRPAEDLPFAQPPREEPTFAPPPREDPSFAAPPRERPPREDSIFAPLPPQEPSFGASHSEETILSESRSDESVFEEPVFAGRAFEDTPIAELPIEDDLSEEELGLFADQESLSRPRPTLLADPPGAFHEDVAAMDAQQFRIPPDEIPADVFASVVGGMFDSSDEDLDVLEALEDFPDSEDDDQSDAHEMRFFTPTPAVDERQPPPPPSPSQRFELDFRRYVIIALVLLILVLTVANVVRLSNRFSNGAVEEGFAQRVESLENTIAEIPGQISSIQSTLSSFQAGLATLQDGAKKNVAAISDLADRVTLLEAMKEAPRSGPSNSTRSTATAAAAPAASAPAKKRRATPRSSSQIPASAPSAAWIGCPSQVCSRSGSTVRLRNVTAVWASPYSGERVAVLGSGTYTIVSVEDVSGYLWLKVRLK